MRRHMTASLLWAGMLLVALTGCGNSPPESDGIASASGNATTRSSGASAEPEVDVEEQALKFARCMREHGIQMEDPQTDGGRVAIRINGGGKDKDKMDKAMRACEKYSPKGGGKGAKPISPEDKERMLKHARCMREHGVDMPDPGPDGNLQFGGSVGGDRNKAVEAASACQQYLPNGGELRNLSPEQLEQARTFAKCMREHGIDMPDPDPATGLSGLLNSGVDFNSPAFKAAADACRVPR
jgi:hypothetical protein